jgi:hypothetical protein
MGESESRGERCTFWTLKKGSEVPSLYVRNVSAALGRFGSGANPLQLLPANSPRSLVRLKKGRSDAHHRDGQGRKIITFSRPPLLRGFKDGEGTNLVFASRLDFTKLLPRGNKCQIAHHQCSPYQSVGISPLYPPLLFAVIIKVSKLFPVEPPVSDCEEGIADSHE